MSLLYNILINVVFLFLRVITLFNSKIKLFVKGRKETFSRLSVIKPSDKVVWIHSASLGEFEQARPIIERIKKEYPQYKIVVTFFSPSGYEIRKNYDLADVVCYLPFDSSSKVRRFIQQVHPNLAIIVKYEFWPNLLNELKNTQTKTILVSGIFRKSQTFFKPYGSWMRKPLFAFDHFFVQNNISEELLNSVGFKNVTVSGDTRFDRVYKILQQNNSLDFVAKFKSGKHTVVAGSSWLNGEDFFVNYINNQACEEEKFIIAPHKIETKNVEELEKKLKVKTVLFSQKEGKDLSKYQVFIIDTIGVLTKIYSYADVAYVGGGFETGLHNILEPATFGIPVFFGGNKFQKFQEAVDLVELGGCKIVKNQQEFSELLKSLYLNTNLKTQIGEINRKYVKSNIGSTDKIFTYINKQL